MNLPVGSAVLSVPLGTMRATAFLSFLLLLILVESRRGRGVNRLRQVRSDKFKASVNKHITKIEQELGKLKNTLKKGQI